MDPQKQENVVLHVVAAAASASKAEEENTLKEQEASSQLLKSLPEKLVEKAEPDSLPKEDGSKDLQPKPLGSHDLLSKTQASLYPNAHDSEHLPPNAHGSQYQLPKAHASQYLHPNAYRSHFLPPKVHGSQDLEPKKQGTQDLPPKAHITRFQSIIIPNNLQDNVVGSTTKIQQDESEDLNDYMNVLLLEGFLVGPVSEKELLYAIATMQELETAQKAIENGYLAPENNISTDSESNNEQPQREQSMSEDQLMEENIALRERDLDAMVFDATTMEPSDFEAAATLQYLAAMCRDRAAIEAAPAQPIPGPNIQQVSTRKRRARKMARKDCRKITKTSSYIIDLTESDTDEQPINVPCFDSPPQTEALRLVKTKKPDEDIGKKQGRDI